MTWKLAAASEMPGEDQHGTTVEYSLKVCISTDMLLRSADLFQTRRGFHLPQLLCWTSRIAQESWQLAARFGICMVQTVCFQPRSCTNFWSHT